MSLKEQNQKRTTENEPPQPAKKAKLNPDTLPQTPAQPSQTLYIKNLNDKINVKTLKHNLYLMFSTYGDIIDIVLKNYNMRGQAHVIFGNIDSSVLALRSLQNEVFFGKPLNIVYSKSKSELLTRLEGDSAVGGEPEQVV